MRERERERERERLGEEGTFTERGPWKRRSRGLGTRSAMEGIKGGKEQGRERETEQENTGRMNKDMPARV